MKKKQIVVISNDGKSVTVRNQVFNAFGISVGPADIGIINFDNTESDANKVYQYAKTRIWDLYAEPASVTRTGTTLFSPKDLGPKPEGTLVETRVGKSTQVQATYTLEELPDGTTDAQAKTVAEAVGADEIVK